MKNSQSWKALLFILACIVGFGSTVEAVGVRLQFLIPTGGSAEVNGFNEADPQTSGLGLSLLLPATESLRIVTGYNYFEATIEETQDNTTLSRKTMEPFTLISSKLVWSILVSSYSQITSCCWV